MTTTIDVYLKQAEEAKRRRVIIPEQFDIGARRRDVKPLSRRTSEDDGGGGGGGGGGISTPVPIVTYIRGNRGIRSGIGYTDVSYYTIVRGTNTNPLATNPVRQIQKQFVDRSWPDINSSYGQFPMIFPYTNPAYEYPIGRYSTYDPYGYDEWLNWADLRIGPEPNIDTAFRVRDYWTVTGISGWSPWVTVDVHFRDSGAFP